MYCACNCALPMQCPIVAIFYSRLFQIGWKRVVFWGSGLKKLEEGLEIYGKKINFYHINSYVHATECDWSLSTLGFSKFLMC